VGDHGTSRRAAGSTGSPRGPLLGYGRRRVTKIEVTPPIKDSGYRREFTERMMGYLFNPATTRDGRHVEYIASLVVYP